VGRSPHPPICRDAAPGAIFIKRFAARRVSGAMNVKAIASLLLALASLGTGCDSGDDTPMPTPTPRLSVRGAEILDPAGAPILLRGWNWGQWGTAQPEDAADNVAQGANVVRIPLRWWGDWGDGSVDARRDDAPGHIDPDHLAVLDGAIRSATDAHLWVDLFVDSNCGQASIENGTVAVCGAAADGSPASFLNDPASKQRFVELWQFLAARYADTPYIGMYEILPEPNFTCSPKGCSDWSATPSFYASIIPAIRAIDPRTPILVGPAGAYEIRRIDTAYIPGVDNLIYTGNFLNGASQKPELLAFATDFRTAHDAPVFIQQIGVRQSETEAAAIADNILGLLSRNDIGWTWWTYREQHSRGTGYAPFWLDQDDGTWHKNDAWLAVISRELATSP
jgi:hypothetical protein